jgi:hypothetical protein
MSLILKVAFPFHFSPGRFNCEIIIDWKIHIFTKRKRVSDRKLEILQNNGIVFGNLQIKKKAISFIFFFFLVYKLKSYAALNWQNVEAF